MAIEVTRDPHAEAPYERCCFCRRATPYWYTPKDVAVCIYCAEVRDADDVPTKAAWCAAEDARDVRGYLQHC